MANLILSCVFSGIGFIAFVYGKKNSEYKPMLVGAGLLVYPYFVRNGWVMLGIGAALTAALYFWRD